MPSRAVLRKKQRREAKRQKSDGDAATTPSHRIAPPHLGEGDESGSAAYRAAHPTALRKRSHDAASAASTSTAVAGAADGLTSSSATVAVAKRARREPPPPPAVMPEGLTRKERHRWETSQRLERQMSRLTTTSEAVTEMLADAAAQRATSRASPAEGQTAPQEAVAEQAGDDTTAAVAPPEEAGPRLRHDPKFKHGTFWRDRKEKRARTLFLGGIPAYFTIRQVTDFISTVIDSDPNAIDYVDAIGKGTEVVEEVDMLPVKHQSKVKHMYVTMASVPLAGCAAAMLDRYKMEGRELRCNFAADKTQREEAIRRRNTAQR